MFELDSLLQLCSIAASQCKEREDIESNEKHLSVPTKRKRKATEQIKSKKNPKKRQKSKKEDDDENIYCICRKGDDGTTMIACDMCNEWFHCKCVKVAPKIAKTLANYLCQNCTNNKSKPIENTVSPPITKKRKTSTSSSSPSPPSSSKKSKLAPDHSPSQKSPTSPSDLWENCHIHKTRMKTTVRCPVNSNHKYCTACLSRHFSIELRTKEVVDANDHSLDIEILKYWPQGCPACTGTCPCAACRRTRGLKPCLKATKLDSNSPEQVQMPLSQSCISPEQIPSATSPEDFLNFLESSRKQAQTTVLPSLKDAIPEYGFSHNSAVAKNGLNASITTTNFGMYVQMPLNPSKPKVEPMQADDKKSEDVEIIKFPPQQKLNFVSQKSKMNYFSQKTDSEKHFLTQFHLKLSEPNTGILLWPQLLSDAESAKLVKLFGERNETEAEKEKENTEMWALKEQIAKQIGVDFNVLEIKTNNDERNNWNGFEGLVSATLSFGKKRILEIRNRKNKKKKWQIELASGSMFVSYGDLENYQFSMVADEKEPRNLGSSATIVLKVMQPRNGNSIEVDSKSPEARLPGFGVQAASGLFGDITSAMFSYADTQGV